MFHTRKNEEICHCTRAMPFSPMTETQLPGFGVLGSEWGYTKAIGHSARGRPPYEIEVFAQEEP